MEGVRAGHPVAVEDHAFARASALGAVEAAREAVLDPLLVEGEAVAACGCEMAGLPPRVQTPTLKPSKREDQETRRSGQIRSTIPRMIPARATRRYRRRGSLLARKRPIPLRTIPATASGESSEPLPGMTKMNNRLRTLAAKPLRAATFPRRRSSAVVVSLDVGEA
jgi:hypothetical protein